MSLALSAAGTGLIMLAVAQALLGITSDPLAASCEA